MDTSFFYSFFYKKYTGCSRSRTLLRFGLKIGGMNNNGDFVNISDLTICSGKQSGLEANRGLDVHVTRCTVEYCWGNGVVAYNANISCDNLQVIGCGMSGVLAYAGSSIKLCGEETQIQDNAMSESPR